MEPSKIITISKRKFILVFEDVREGDHFLEFGHFTQDCDVAFVHCDSVTFEIEYSNREELSDFMYGLSATDSKVMEYHAAFSLNNMPDMKRAFLCSWQHMYYLMLFTSFDDPFTIMVDVRRNEKDSIDSMKELCEDFLQESYENHGIRLEPIVQE